ncbi:MAG: hypothetical protein KR126chlam4_00968 [Candidatus Anoxychlamydiales bacterium]|uniref:Uncharacterized protein n=1 Tax=marine sediment metagenome TaxID=412755 RepID=A0A0F9EQY4_9ZZZZ|nr:hypothetical protein [Candidatus Anoxychlamydiales bacterium]NGX41130.1 hypothetical protein [Candidatus Anoxychlamydiales bacterium]HEU63949.1 hypothetical protein [Chlamydiota bacterium]
MSIQRTPSMCNLLNVVNQAKELERTKNASSPSSGNDYLEKSKDLTNLLRTAIKQAKRNHSKKETIASILDADPMSTIQLTFLGL